MATDYTSYWKYWMCGIQPHWLLHPDAVTWSLLLIRVFWSQMPEILGAKENTWLIVLVIFVIRMVEGVTGICSEWVIPARFACKCVFGCWHGTEYHSTDHISALFFQFCIKKREDLIIADFSKISLVVHLIRTFQIFLLRVRYLA